MIQILQNIFSTISSNIHKKCYYNKNNTIHYTNEINQLTKLIESILQSNFNINNFENIHNKALDSLRDVKLIPCEMKNLSKNNEETMKIVETIFNDSNEFLRQLENEIYSQNYKSKKIGVKKFTKAMNDLNDIQNSSSNVNKVKNEQLNDILERVKELSEKKSAKEVKIKKNFTLLILF